MRKEEIRLFIKEQKGRNKSDEDIHQTLLLQGWSEKDINEEFKSIDIPLFIEKPKKSTTSSLGIKKLLSNAFGLYKRNH